MNQDDACRNYPRVQLSPGGAFESAPSATVIQSDDGELTVSWPHGRGRVVVMSVELLEQIVTELSAIRRLID